MKIGLRGGHSANCIGAVGIVNEYEQMQKYFKAVSQVLTDYGHTVIDCNSNGSNAGAELSEGATKSNTAGVDLFVSLHMNASNGQGHGVETLVSSANSGAYKYALNLCNNFGSLFTNRGVKFENLYEMNHIQAPNIIFELCFCDNETDIMIYNNYSWDQLAYRFANAIDPNIPIEPPTDNQKGYVVTNYLPPLSAIYDGVNVNAVLEYFEGVTCYVRGNNNGVWIETQYLSLSKCQELKNTLDLLFYEIKR
ncbi:N-acetylmuramoyl-L-alanine amidase [Clostridium saccharoperbutylacetonicum]|uniref:N-acetylmuramoyl-L-alanine amidase n=1 Tax=Clostridium saccharoperbutylacetonicum TaxID=36745 RepID=UPI000983C874|nr:N-acetylmuramoyl-L-alanine amidase [Clostridium saccharoperbutylacetonicum]AQR98099.1 N-acetylmuramoyl-L-alanine amidase [Clostridium saccharoperbutylacetonicum]NSB33993.1 N-acetylmuramoyl-L-alanine amidase [Clostridium saccharoperbutylacetonicum]